MHKSKREVKELVAELAPKPDVPAQIRKLPERSENMPQPLPSPEPNRPVNLIGENQKGGRQSTASGRSRPQPASVASVAEEDRREQIEPLAPARYKVQFTASAELRDKLDQLTAAPRTASVSRYRRSSSVQTELRFWLRART